MRYANEGEMLCRLVFETVRRDTIGGFFENVHMMKADCKTQGLIAYAAAL